MTPPGPNGPNCVHDRRPWETTGPEARDTHLAKRVTLFFLRRGPQTVPVWGIIIN